VVRNALFAAAAILAGAGSVVAHHSISAVYDSTRRTTLEGIVSEFQLVNPHPFLLLDVGDAAGRARRWKLEMDNRGELAAVGVTARTFKPGDRVIVSGSPGRTEPETLYVLRLDRPADGFWYEQVGFSPRIGGASR
jgi:hypothetical protein